MKQYCLSKYNIEVAEAELHLIFNQVSSACVVLDEKHYFALKNDSIDKNMEGELVSLGILVPVTKDETLDFIAHVKKKNHEDKSLFYRILTTTACNAKCPYCYEKDLPISNMSALLAEKVVDYIKGEIKDNNKVIIQWFGGEPLLKSETISTICEMVKSHCENSGIYFESQMITNGYLFFKENIRNQIPRWNLKHVQISLDGTSRKYEQIKQFGNDKSLEVVVENIKYLSNNGVDVAIRLNYNEDNLSEIFDLIDYLSVEFAEFNNIRVYGNHLFDDNLCNNRSDYVEIENSVFDKLYSSGFIKNIFATIPIRTGCFAGKSNGGAIMPNGDLCYCSLAATRPELNIGNICSPSELHRSSSWTYDILPTECLKCNIMPLCFGGCLFERFSGMKYCLENRQHIEHKLRVALKSSIQAK